MTRTILFPALLLSGLAFAAAPAAPAAPATPAATPAAPAPATPATPAAKPATPAKPAIPLAVFKDLDKNNDKALDKAELATMADLVRDFSMVDTDKNGKLNEAEYSAWSDKQKQM